MINIVNIVANHFCKQSKHPKSATIFLDINIDKLSNAASKGCQEVIIFYNIVCFGIYLPYPKSLWRCLSTLEGVFPIRKPK